MKNSSSKAKMKVQWQKYTNDKISILKNEVLVSVERFHKQIVKEHKANLVYIGRQAEIMSGLKDSLSAEMTEIVRSIFTNKLFLKSLNKSIILQVEQEINYHYGKTGISTFIKSELNSELKNNMGVHINKTVNQVMTKMNKQLDSQLIHAKTVLYSLDKEINHFAQRNGISDNTDFLVRKLIDKEFNKELLTNNLLKVES